MTKPARVRRVADDEELGVFDVALERARSLPVFEAFLKDPRLADKGMTDEYREVLRRAHFWRRKPTVDDYFALLHDIHQLVTGTLEAEPLTSDEEEEGARGYRLYREHLLRKRQGPV